MARTAKSTGTSAKKKSATTKSAKTTAKKKSATKSAKTSAKAPAKELAVIGFATPEAWSAWLVEHHATSPGIWMRIAKGGAATQSITYAQAVEVALTWGWIDGQKRKLDDAAWLQQFSRRRARSPWSKLNREKVIALIDAGKMHPPGLAEVERAKGDGRWDKAYDSAKNMGVPDDFAGAIAANPRAAEFFAKLDSRNRYAILWRVHDAKRAETRARRIADFVAMLAKHEKLYP